VPKHKVGLYQVVRKVYLEKTTIARGKDIGPELMKVCCMASSQAVAARGAVRATDKEIMGIMLL
jgi:hypothetical protein